jgi:hypothetical protein
MVEQVMTISGGEIVQAQFSVIGNVEGISSQIVAANNMSGFELNRLVTLKGGINCLLFSAITPINCEPFDWVLAEKRADWEQQHGCFIEFNNLTDLLSDLHS